MNAGFVGLLLVSLALGIAVTVCWRYMQHPLTRYIPGVLALAYYVAMKVWPAPAVLAFRAGRAYANGDAIRLGLLGLALMVAIIELSVRLHRAVRNNAALRRELENR